MRVLIDVLKELVGMFVADIGLTVAVLVLVEAVAAMSRFDVPPLWRGAVLLGGCLVILVEAVTRMARAQRKGK
ncbi:hypothetical protein [Achromobacter aloeverae]|uniref:Uncharacterized protein n=1 Tax=Achromobacter aloeverae TaxID=1750518 RepID=A0A4Q1HQW7_9BURK|nr:hypothetical protein [Achromobacter aloeverae]RXN93369.1 hypothetical protein C7R54_06665 [Achromobacter aloeverae]